MFTMGFTKTVTGSDFIFLPCPLGTFSNSSVPNNNKCTECPPGGFYSDTLAYVAEGCKKCPNGSYIAFDKKPGKSILDCKPCPLEERRVIFSLDIELVLVWMDFIEPIYLLDVANVTEVVDWYAKMNMPH